MTDALAGRGLLWIGCAGAFDDRNRRVVRAMAQLLRQAEVPFAVLGSQETCSGDPARRAKAIVEATTHYRNPEILARVSENLGQPMVGIGIHTLAAEDQLATRGW